MPIVQIFPCLSISKPCRPLISLKGSQKTTLSAFQRTPTTKEKQQTERKSKSCTNIKNQNRYLFKLTAKKYGTFPKTGAVYSFEDNLKFISRDKTGVTLNSTENVRICRKPLADETILYPTCFSSSDWCVLERAGCGTNQCKSAGFVADERREQVNDYTPPGV